MNDVLYILCGSLNNSALLGQGLQGLGAEDEGWAGKQAHVEDRGEDCLRQVVPEERELD